MIQEHVHQIPVDTCQLFTDLTPVHFVAIFAHSDLPVAFLFLTQTRQKDFLILPEEERLIQEIEQTQQLEKTKDVYLSRVMSWGGNV